MQEFSKDDLWAQVKAISPNSTHVETDHIDTIKIDDTSPVGQHITAANEGISAERQQQTVGDVPDFHLDRATPLSPGSFPNPPRAGFTMIPATIPNTMFLLESYGIQVRYNIIKKRLSITIPGLVGSPDNADNSSFAHIESLANLNGTPTGKLGSFIEAIGDRNLYNPAASWILSKPWDGIDRLPAYYNTLTEQEDYPAPLKMVLMHRWSLGAVAAALKPSGFYNRGVLTLQGRQGIGKTSWFRSLINDQALQESLIKTGLHLDAGNKDSLLTAICHWIAELGELDSTFKKDVARLKGFLSNDVDKVRRPYARTESEYGRHTVFCASVNDKNFLVDTTGNTRFWVIAIDKADFNHGLDMQQLFAQLAVDFQAGKQWWLSPEEEHYLGEHNLRHRSISVIAEKILSVLDLDREEDANLPAMTATEILKEAGIEHPTNSQCKEAVAVLREYLGESKRIRGLEKWRVPLKQRTWSPSKPPGDDDY